MLETRGKRMRASVADAEVLNPPLLTAKPKAKATAFAVQRARSVFDFAVSADRPGHARLTLFGVR